ncbi:Rhomboid protease gluP [Dermatophilus congolensis]|uniref:Rhomboid protease gluP n=1 Tax=Dermatophilus congolensis TaxID=1863 RepID=A0AA46H1F9_9MICO|nr:rhomboid family intramembrane serine protease [Dermatophilus congolensis]STD14899.1 Rhomboid protease gluP [Dermatophilus congolensis]
MDQKAPSPPTNRSHYAALTARQYLTTPVTYTLIALCILVWFAQLIPSLDHLLFQNGAFMPSLGALEPWRFLTASFLHAPQIWHLLFNMLCLWVLGRTLEPAINTKFFLASYCVCAIGGSVGSIWFSTSITDPNGTWMQATVGASGAIFGLFAILFVLAPTVGADIRGILAALFINATLPLFIEGIVWQSQLGGLFTGFMIGALCALQRKICIRTLRWLGLAAIAAALIALAWHKYEVVGSITHLSW